MTHRSRNRWLGTKTKHSEARSLRGLPRVLEGKGDGSCHQATLREVNGRVSQRVSYHT